LFEERGEFIVLIKRIQDGKQDMGRQKGTAAPSEGAACFVSQIIRQTPRDEFSSRDDQDDFDRRGWVLFPKSHPPVNLQ
jgi:hypothetical protein